eukprot:jgi/Psemu1/285696/fgenesh1_pg.99_\
MAATTAHLVIPGQVIATSSTNQETDNQDEGFLRGHGTFVEHDASKQEDRLVASVCGVVHRVNKLITVVPYCPSLYKGNVGDLVIGRISAVGISRWSVSLHESSKDAGLPLSGVHLPGGAQRMRTSQDSRDMRLFLREGDLVCAEVHKGMKDVADLQEKMRKDHADTPVDVDLRRSLARLRNAIECLRMVHALCAPENAEAVYQKSLELGLANPSDMLLPEHVLVLTEEFRSA